MKICIVGSGYVGLPTSACFAESGIKVIGVETDAQKLKMLKEGKCPIYEPGLAPLLERNIESGRLIFTDSISRDAVDCDFYFICVGTPPDESGKANLTYLWQAVSDIASALSKDCVVAVKSTVPIGTTRKVTEVIVSELQKRGKNHEVSVAFTPEFLKQGRAVEDTFRPDRFIFGVDDDATGQKLKVLYKPFNRYMDRALIMKPESAEMTKYAANAMLATRISFMNELSVICDKTGADIEDVRYGIGLDKRIGPLFLYAGVGYGGSCFPKDVEALIKASEAMDYQPYILQAVKKRNEVQKEYLYTKLAEHFDHDLKGKKIALWGLSFKPDTDDMREAPSLVIIRKLIESGAKVAAFDPIAIESARKAMPSEWEEQGLVSFNSQQYDILIDADALLLVTEWKSFRTPDFQKLKSLMREKVIFDGRNQYDPAQVIAEGFEYYGIGRGVSS